MSEVRVGGAARLLSDSTKCRYIKHIKSWANSCSTQADYCQRNNLNINTFSYIRSKQLRDRKNKSVSAKRFVQVTPKVSTQSATNTLLSISLHLSSGYKLELPVGLSRSEFTAIFTAFGVLS